MANWNKTPCYVWTGSCTPKGYARVKIGGRYYRISRIFGKIKYGKLTKKDLICHHCDNPQCINPSHFFKGTPIDNRMDCVSKGRHAKGVNHGQSKLTSKIVARIRSKYKWRRDGGMAALAKKYGVGISTIHRVLSGELWV